MLALRRLAGLVEAGLLSEPMAVQVARSTGQTTARLAEWQIDSFLEGPDRAARAGHDPHRGHLSAGRAAAAGAGGVPRLRVAAPARRRDRPGGAGRGRRGDGRPPARRRLRRPGRLHPADPAAGGGGARRAGRGVRDHRRRPGGRARRPADQDARRRGALRGRRRGHGRGDRAAADRDDEPRRDDARAARRDRLRHGHHPDGRCLRHHGEPGQPADVHSAQGRGPGRRRVRRGADPYRRGPGLRGGGRGGGRRRGEGRRGAALVPLRAPADVAAAGAWPRRGRALAADPAQRERLLARARAGRRLGPACRRPHRQVSSG